jgi:hypothetical protein
MNKPIETKKKMSLGFVLIGIMLLIMGGIMIFQGIEANRTGAIIQQTWKTGPMTGIESILTGCVAGAVGFVFISVELVRNFFRK